MILVFACFCFLYHKFVFDDIIVCMNKQIINGEEITTLFENEKIRIETILSFGNSSPDGFWYCQHEDEWVLLTNGNAKIQFEDCEKHLCKDDGRF